MEPEAISITDSATESSIDVSPIKDREHFAISVPSAGIAAVTNTRHDEPTTYAVNVADSGETVECTCPADQYQDKCKHRVAVEANPAVLEAGSASAEEMQEARQ